MKLNALLAKTDHSASQFKEMLKDYLSFFKKEQGQFKGVRKIYTPREGMMDEPSRRAHINVVTTVDEKLGWFEEQAADHISNVFSIEATNASSLPRANLIVDGVDWGEYSSLELLRLKSLLETGELINMYASIPVRSDAERWAASAENGFDRPGIWSQEQTRGTAKSQVKKTVILHDPNAGTGRAPVTGIEESIIELGDWEAQLFSGEWSHKERADVLKRRSIIHAAVIVALKEANESEQVKSNLTGEKILGYLHHGVNE